MGLLKDSRMAADTTTEGPTRAFRSFATASAAEMEDVENKRLQTLNSSMASLGPLPSLATLAQSSAPLSLLARRTSLNNMNTNAVSGGAAAAGVATSAASAAANFATSLVSSFSSFSSSLSSPSNSSPTRRPTPVKATTTTTTTTTATATATATTTASATATSTATNSNNGSPNSSRPLTSASAHASSTTTLGLERAVERMLLLAGSTPSPSFVSANDSASLSEMLFLENDAFAASPVSDPLSASSASSASSAATFDGDFMDECASVAPSDRQWRLARAREHALRELQLSKAAAAEAADAADAAAAATTAAAANRSPRNTVRSSSQPCFGSESDTDTSPSRESKDDSDINNSSNSDDSELFSLTPGRRRSVSWGDVSGAGLVDSVCFWQDDAPCRCGKKKEVGAARPKSPYLDSELPLSHRELMRQLSEQGVQLEHSMIRWPLVFLSIRVLNLGFEKSVFLRTSSDGWKTHTDVPASYLEQASDRLTDEFQAALRVPSTTTQDETEFAICCQMNGREYWDNNNGRNYRMQFCHRHQSILGAPSPAGPNACCSPTVPQSPLKPCLKAKPW